jgi:hypothetical protein
MKAIQKMQPDAVIVQACSPEGQAQQAQLQGCDFPAADGRMHKPEIDGCPFVPGRGW